MQPHRCQARLRHDEGPRSPGLIQAWAVLDATNRSPPWDMEYVTCKQTYDIERTPNGVGRQSCIKDYVFVELIQNKLS